jgi:isoquinoline 1-oxidoreductase alpha subunit
MRYTLNINGQDRSVDVDADTSLLWVLRNSFNLKGTRYGCGKGECGACTVHVDGVPKQACQTPISTLGTSRIVTIEGIGETAAGKRVMAAWMRARVVQCGYCQGGLIMAAAALLTENPKPNDIAIGNAIEGHLCRCGTYERVQHAIKLAADEK